MTRVASGWWWPTLGWSRCKAAAPLWVGRPRLGLPSGVWNGRAGSALPTLAICPPAAGQGGKGLPLGNPGPLRPLPPDPRLPAGFRDHQRWHIPVPALTLAASMRLILSIQPPARGGTGLDERTLPLPVILTVHRFRSSHLSARQTASGLGE